MAIEKETNTTGSKNKDADTEGMQHCSKLEFAAMIEKSIASGETNLTLDEIFAEVKEVAKKHKLSRL